MAITEQGMLELDRKYGLQPVGSASSPTNYNQSRLSELRGLAEEERVSEAQIPRSSSVANKIPVVKQLSDFGTGVGTAIGKIGLGGAQALMKTSKFLGEKVGADTQYAQRAIEDIGKVKTRLYDEPFREQTSTFSGKAGNVVGNVAPYVATAGAVNPATASLPRLSQIIARTIPDMFIAGAQTGGDAKATAGSTIASGLANAILPGAGEVAKGVKGSLKEFGKNTAAGYVSDVALGLSGQRGEDREGASAFIPGAGTALGASIGTVVGAKNLMSGTDDVNKIINKRVKELQKLEDSNSKIRKVVNKTKAQGLDPKKILAQTDLLNGAVDNTGTLRTQNATQELTDFIKPQEKVITNNLKREGVIVKLDDVKKVLVDEVNNSGIKGGAKLRALKNIDDDIAGLMLEADETGKIPLAVIHDAKIDKYANINYLNPESKRVDKAIARGLKSIVEKNTKSADVQALNKELSSHYAVLDLLEKLDGTKVDGGKLGKYFASTIGGIVGSHFGPLGAIAGAEIGAGIKGGMMSSKFKGETGINLEQSEAMKKAIQQGELPPLGLPAPKSDVRSSVGSGAPIPLGSRLPDETQAFSNNPNYSSNLGNRNTAQSITTAPSKISIPKIVSDTTDAVNKGLEDPTLMAMYKDNPQEFVDDIQGMLSKSLREQGDEVSAEVIENVQTTSSFKDFVNKVYKALGGDIPNKQGGFAKNPFIKDDKGRFAGSIASSKGDDIYKNSMTSSMKETIDDIDRLPYSKNPTPEKVAKLIDTEDLLNIEAYLANDNLTNYQRIQDIIEGAGLEDLSFKDLSRFFSEVYNIKMS